MRALAESDRGSAQPDIVFRTLQGEVPLVAEVKNTSHAKTATIPDRSEVEQAVTYAVRYGLTFALLIHPWVRGARGLAYVGRIGGVDVYDYRLDLSSDAGFDAAIDDMAEALARLAGLGDRITPG
jgi:5-methylcytosine-specific restriction enzyme subunit McrC